MTFLTLVFNLSQDEKRVGGYLQRSCRNARQGGLGRKDEGSATLARVDEGVCNFGLVAHQ